MIKATKDNLTSKIGKFWHGTQRAVATGVIGLAMYGTFNGTEYLGRTQVFQDIDASIDRAGINYLDQTAEKIGVNRENSTDYAIPLAIACLAGLATRKIAEEVGY